ncbi:MAG: AraC family transcriptional regulator [Mediterranea massiliensis]|nr:AraC family transcriptional regulator [Mediterranea massiliensis]
MGYDNFILTVNSSSIILLMVLAIILLTATRFRGESGYAAAIIVLPNVPVYLYNMSRMLGWHDFSLFMLPISYSANTLLMPLLWLFAKKNFDPSFRLKPLDLLHLLPGLTCLILCLSMSTEEQLDSIRYETTGEDSLLGDVNTTLVFLQMVGYFTAIFRFLHRKKKLINDTASDAEWMQKEWIIVFEYLFAGLFVIVMVCYAIWPRTDAWLIQILNVVAMFYLVYNTIAHPVMPIAQQIIETEKPMSNEPESPSVPLMSDNQMKEVCEVASRHMSETKSYLRPDISLALFAKEVNIPQRTLSRSINGYLGCNFFEFVNRMRIEEAKRRLRELNASGYNIDSIYTDCGFRSRSTFYMVFKKITGETPAAWLEKE